MVCALTIVVAAKLPTLQHRSTVVTIVVKKKKHSRRYLALNLVYNYCIGLTIVVNEKIADKTPAELSQQLPYMPTDCRYNSCKRRKTVRTTANF
jgi:hypothetical protein